MKMETLTKAELQKIAAERNIYFTKSDTKRVLIANIRKQEKPFFPSSMSAKTSRHR